jgi:pimeloyl-ACP methyl ester carboxylesterase
MVSGTGSSAADPEHAHGVSAGGEHAEPDEAGSKKISSSSSFGFERLHCEVGGPQHGEPVLLIHGWGSSAGNMRPIAQALSDTYRVYNLDLPGHGLSPEATEAFGVPEHAALVAELIRDKIRKPVSIIGHSNGGRIALFMASEPSMKRLIRRLVLVSPSGVPPHRPPSYYVKKYLARALKAPFEILPDHPREFGLDWLRHSLVWRALGSSDYRALEGVMRDTFVKTVTFYVDDRLREIEAPTLLIWGERDTAVSRYQMSVLEERIRDAGLIILESAGHYGYLDDFDTFIGATRHFLENDRGGEA